MDIDWMTGKELSEAIPPAYTEWIAKQFDVRDTTLSTNKEGDDE